MTLTVNGVNLLPYVAYGGVKWQRNDLDSEDAGRTLDGVMHRGRVATKIRLDITCRPLTLAEASIVLTAIQPETVSVTYTDPMNGADRTTEMYANNNPATYHMRKKHGQTYTDLWSGITFPLVEV